MKRMAFLASLLGLAKLARGQSNKISIERQVRGVPGSLVAFNGAGDAVAVKPDTSIIVDTAGGTIRAVAGVARREMIETQRVSSGQAQLFGTSLPVAQDTVLKVFLNGLFQAPGAYVLGVGGVQFTGQQINNGDNVTLMFWTV